jgi:hypothetical protein
VTRCSKTCVIKANLSKGYCDDMNWDKPVQKEYQKDFRNRPGERERATWDQPRHILRSHFDCVIHLPNNLTNLHILTHDHNIVTYSGFSINDGTLLHSKSQYTTVKHSRQLLEHTYTSDPHDLVTLIPIEFFQQGLLWQSSNTHSHSCCQKASKHTSGQSIVGLSVHFHTTTAPRRIVRH